MPPTFKHPVARAATDAQLMRIVSGFRGCDTFNLVGPSRGADRYRHVTREPILLLRRGRTFLLLTCISVRQPAESVSLCGYLPRSGQLHG